MSTIDRSCDLGSGRRSGSVGSGSVGSASGFGLGWLGVRLGAGVLAVILVIGLSAAPARAITEESKQTATDGAVGAAAGLSSVVYAPLKVAYAAGGSIVAGLAYVLSGGDGAVAKPIIDASVRGDYVVTPANLRGEKPLEFIGRPAGDQKLQPPAVSSAPRAAEATPPAPETAGAGESWR
jgi:hypothetical protein